jgi:hypothetical protein
MANTPNVPIDDLVRQLAVMPGTKLRMTLQGLLDQPIDPQARRRLLRSLDACAERIDRLISMLESPNADWQSGRRDMAEMPAGGRPS